MPEILTPLPGTRSELGESPFWHIDERSLYWCDIEGRAIRCLRPDGSVQHWAMPSEPGCIAPAGRGSLVVALRDGIHLFATDTSSLRCLAPAPYDVSRFRFNDGRCDASGRFLAGTISERRTASDAHLYALQWQRDHWATTVLADDVMTANGLAFSPDERTLYWADTRAHRIDRFDVDAATGLLTNRRPFAVFPGRSAGDPAARYGGRPDGAAVDREGGYWVAMYEGARILRLLPDGRIDREIPVPVQCPTMVCFGGEGLRTLYVTTARSGRSDEELAAQPDAGFVFTMACDVAGLPVNEFNRSSENAPGCS